MSQERGKDFTTDRQQIQLLEQDGRKTHTCKEDHNNVTLAETTNVEACSQGSNTPTDNQGESIWEKLKRNGKQYQEPHHHDSDTKTD